jgi:thiopeptide-type bacteriocin biosynthesis protein
MPSDDADLRWFALHVHRYADQDAFLRDALAPVVAGHAPAGFFYLRYWQGGSHIRLRLRLRDDEAVRVLDEVTAAFRAYFVEHPQPDGASERDRAMATQPYMAALENEAALDVRPPDTIWPADYHPETGKYGGSDGVAVAEDFFQASSTAALAALSAPDWKPGRRLGTAFATMVRTLHAIGMSPAAMTAFFAHYCRIWAPYVFEPFLDAWPSLLDRQRDTLRAVINSVLDGPARGEPAPDAAADAWERLHRNKDRILPYVRLAGLRASEDRRAQVILSSYLHTHNNRLGLIPEQEAFLGFLGHRVLAADGHGPGVDLPATVRALRERHLPITTQPGKG